MKIPLLVIAGPTGVGKTASAVALVHRVPLEVVSADSRQVYRRMDVATGKPTAEERAAVARGLPPNDYVRVMRALELTRAGRSPGARDDLWRRSRDYDVLHVGLTMERAELARRLRVRAAEMVEAGLLDEVRALLASGYDPTLPAMQGIGYRQFVAVAQGERTPAAGTRLLQRDSVAHAKRPWAR